MMTTFALAFRLCPRRFHGLAPLLDLASQKRRELFGCISDELRAFGRHSVAHFGQGDDSNGFAMQPANDIARGPCRNRDTEPRAGFEAFQALLADRWNLRHCGDALQTRDTERTH